MQKVSKSSLLHMHRRHVLGFKGFGIQHAGALQELAGSAVVLAQSYKT